LLSEGVLDEGKIPSEGLGRPKYAYAILLKVKKLASDALLEPSIELIHLPSVA
jgi:hypothetical protein